AAADRVEQPVGDRADLRGGAGVMAEIRPREQSRFQDEAGDIHRLDRARGLAVADEMAADGQGFEGAEECIPPDGVIDNLAALALGDLSDPLDEILPRIDDGKSAAMAAGDACVLDAADGADNRSAQGARPLAEQLADPAGRGMDQ